MHASNFTLLCALVGTAVALGGCSSDASTPANSYGGSGGGGFAGSAGADAGSGGSGTGGVAGSGGTAGLGGTSGSGGSAGTAGSSGSAGAGGAAGSSATGGTGGVAGADAGAAGTGGGAGADAGVAGMGGAAGAGGADAGAGGAAGTAGAGGTGGDPCAAANCDPVATCTNQGGAAVCKCPTGYNDLNNDGSSCVDIDGCATNADNCDANATCSNTTGGFTCACNWPYYGPGTNCTAPSDLNWDFENWTYSDPPADFIKTPETSFSLTDESSSVNSGAHSCKATWSTTSNRDLFDAMYGTASPGVEYTSHIWVLDDDPAGRARPFLSFYDSSHANPSNSYPTPYSTDSAAWREYTETAAAPAGAAYVRGAVRFYDVGAGFSSATLYVDDFDLTQHVSFNASDAALDALPGKPSTPPEVVAAPLSIHAAFDDAGVLYVSAPTANSANGDRMLFVWIGGVRSSATVAMPWAKNGTVAAPASGGSVFALIQEESTGYCEWRTWDATGSAWSAVTSGAACPSSSGAVLEGTLDAVANTGVASAADVAATFSFSAIAVGTNNGGSIDQSQQTPACSSACDANIDASETLTVHRARLLVGRVQ